jgi:D-alanyl-D-alanine carboxypeptidase
MNQKAHELGMQHTRFANPTGLDAPNQYSTAQDLLRLIEAFLTHSFLAETVQMREVELASSDGGIVHTVLTTNKLLGRDPRIKGIKTGTTPQAKGNLAVLAENEGGHEVIILVLGSSAREADASSLVDWAFANFRWK